MSDAAVRARVALSKWIVFLLAVRPVLNQLRGDNTLLKLGDYNVSVLSLWSLSFLVVATLRLQYGPTAPPPIRRAIIAFLGLVVVFGVPRILVMEALLLDVLTFFQFFLAALTARGVLDDVGIDFVVKRVVAGAVVLLVMHATASAWMTARELVNEDVDGNYLGAFESKHIAGASFFALVPFLACAALRDRRSLGAILLAPTSLFLVLALQRVSILSALIFGLAMVLIARRVRILVPLVVLALAVVTVIPSERFETFMQAKIEQEIEAYSSGDLEKSGAGRMTIVFMAQSWYFDSSTIAEQLIGRGTAQAYQLHFITQGNLAYAHIEVVELMIDYGLIGTGLIFLILIRIGRAKMKALRLRFLPEEIVGMAMTVVIFAQLFYAMPLQDGGTVTLLAFWLFAPRTEPAPTT